MSSGDVLWGKARVVSFQECALSNWDNREGMRGAGLGRRASSFFSTARESSWMANNTVTGRYTEVYIPSLFQSDPCALPPSIHPQPTPNTNTLPKHQGTETNPPLRNPSSSTFHPRWHWHPTTLPWPMVEFYPWKFRISTILSIYRVSLLVRN